MDENFITTNCPYCNKMYRLYKSMLNEHGLKITCSDCYEKFIVEVEIIYKVNVKKNIVKMRR